MWFFISFFFLGNVAQYPAISVKSTVLNKIAGDRLSMSANIVTTELTLLYVCFVDNNTHPYIVYEDLDSYCLLCSNLIGNQCISPKNTTLPQKHDFQVTSYYYNDDCYSTYVLTVQKHHMSTSDNGVVIFLASTGMSFLNKTVELSITPAKFYKEYIIFLVVGVGILIVFCFVVVIVWYFKQRKPKSSPYLSILQPQPEIVGKCVQIWITTKLRNYCDMIVQSPPPPFPYELV